MLVHKAVEGGRRCHEYRSNITTAPFVSRRWLAFVIGTISDFSCRGHANAVKSTSWHQCKLQACGYIGFYEWYTSFRNAEIHGLRSPYISMHIHASTYNWNSEMPLQINGLVHRAAQVHRKNNWMKNRVDRVIACGDIVVVRIRFFYCYANKGGERIFHLNLNSHTMQRRMYGRVAMVGQ